jgi:ABC-type transport system involved in cytochrome c biogenesis permease component
MSELRRGLAVALAIARKDAIAELRGRQAAGSTIFFAAIVLLMFGFALGPDAERTRRRACCGWRSCSAAC